MRLNGVFNHAKCYFLNTSKRYNEFIQPNQLLPLILKSLNCPLLCILRSTFLISYGWNLHSYTLLQAGLLLL